MVPGLHYPGSSYAPSKDIRTAKKLQWYAKTRFTQKSALHRRTTTDL